MGFMGDKQLSGPLLLAQELCQLALTEKWLRDEIYCQLVKQLTNNPHHDSVNKGWWLMSICLETFPPPPEFENYLGERNSERTTGRVGVDRCLLRCAHTRCYCLPCLLCLT